MWHPFERIGGVYGRGKSLSESHQNSKAKQLALFPLKRGESQFHILPEKERWYDPERTLVDIAMLCGSAILPPVCSHFLGEVSHISAHWPQSVQGLVY